MKSISAGALRTLVDYCPETGEMTWRARPCVWFKSRASWLGTNARIAGKPCEHQNGQGYYVAMIAKKPYRVHRLAWLYVYGEWPKGEIDHINGNRTDNRLANLRDVPRRDNMGNVKLRSSNTSGHVGVYKQKDKWVAQAVRDGRHHYLGLYESKSAAIAARAKASARLEFHQNHGRN